VTAAAAPVPFRTALRAWITIALHSFGGPAGQIAVIHRVVVDERGWLSDRRFLHALSYCMLLPGPEAQQLVTYVGWLLHGVRGGLVAGLLFVLPGFVAILVLSVLYAVWRDVGLVAALFFGLKPAVLAIVVEASVRLHRRAAAGPAGTALAAGAFAALFGFGVPFPVVILAAATAGVAIARVRPGWAPAPDDAAAGLAPPAWRAVARTVAIWLAIWLVPVTALVALLGPGHVLAREAVFFSKVAVITFGGAYAVLAYVAQQAVAVYGWLAPGEMLDGLGLAETTPGPLIMVVQFVGFLGAFRESGALAPLLSGVLGAVVTTWVTFAPCFLFIFAGAPYVEHLRNHRALGAVLRGVTAAVVGVVLNLAVWFALHTVFGDVAEGGVGVLRVPLPRVASLDWRALLIAVLALTAVFRLRAGMYWVLGGGALLGLVLAG